jgi:seryl-tRNA(Sec) selenium transferase
MTGAYTIHGGLQTVPSAKRVMEEASHYSANVDEVMAKVGARIAELMGAEAALVSSGAAAGAAHAAAGVITGADPEKISQLPDLTGLKSEVIMPRQSRTPYDFAIRSLGLKIIDVETREDLFSALSDRTAMLQMLAGERSRIELQDMVEAGRKVGVPVLQHGIVE